MAEFRIVVVVDPSRAATGTRRVRAELQQTENAADRLRRTLARAFAFVGVSAGVQQLITLSDTFITIQNRLRTVTQDTDQLTLVTEQLFDVSNRTRTSFQLTAELYTRIALSARQLGVAQGELVAITESVNQAIILSGAGAQEASAGLIQLSQGLASGTLRGDELRSVLEQLPVVADVIAEELGVTRGELRQLGFEGAITADIIINAFRSAEEDLRNRFGRTVPTIAQSFVILRNNLISLIGDFNNASAAIEILSNLIILVADNLDTLIRLVVAAGLVFASTFVQRGVDIAIAAINALTAALSVGLVTALRTAIIALLPVATALLVVFSDQIELGNGRIDTLRDLGVATFQLLTEAVVAFGSAIATVFNFDFSLGFLESVSEIEITLVGLLRFIALANDSIIGSLLGTIRAVAAAYNQLAENARSAFLRTLETARTGTIDFLRELEQVASTPVALLARGIIDALEQIEIEVPERTGTIAGAIAEAFNGALDDVTFTADALEAILERSDQLAQDRLERQRAQEELLRAAQEGLLVPGEARVVPDTDFADLLDRLEDEQRLLSFGNQEREIQEGLLDAERSLKRDLAGTERELVEELLRSTQALQDQRDILDELQAPLENYERGLAALQQLQADGRITTEQFIQAQRDLRIESLATATDFDSGLERSLLSLQRELDNTALAVERTVVDGFRGAEDAIADFAVGAGTSFSDFVDTITRELARLAAQQLLIRPILSAVTGFLGFGASAAAGTAGIGFPVGAGAGFPGPSLTPFQQGGIVGSPTVFDPSRGFGVAGEAGLEGILPLQRDSRGRLGVSATGGQGTVQNNQFNVNVQVTGGDQESSDDLARRTAERVRAELQGFVAEQLRDQQRFGGVLNTGRVV